MNKVNVFVPLSGGNRESVIAIGKTLIDPEGCDRAILLGMEPYEIRMDGDNRGFWKSNLLDMVS